MPTILALERLRQVDHKFKASLSHIVLNRLHGKTLSQKKKKGEERNEERKGRNEGERRKINLN